MLSGVRIVVFAKAPQPGQAKTRLIPALGAERAAALARRMLNQTLAEALAAGLAGTELCASPAPDDGAWNGVNAPPGVRWTEQGEGDLGARMARAAQRVIATGNAVLLIGTDCPALDARTLQVAASALDTADAVMLPTADGGYALLGLRRFAPSVFEGIAWSTLTVATLTLARLRALGWEARVLAEVHDIDEPADLCWLPDAWCGGDEGDELDEVDGSHDLGASGLQLNEDGGKE